MIAADLPKASPDSALAAFNSGYNCAQSVVKVFAEAYSFDKNDFVTKAAGYGGGGFHGICGAVSGAYLVLEMFCSQKSETKNAMFCIETLKKKFRQQFEQLYGTDQCKVLLRNEATQPKNSAHSICERCIVDAVEIINGLLR